MVIERIDLNHFRNYEKLTLFPHEGINIFFGANGSGKTSLLEAVHYCSLGKSHRITQDANAVMMGEKGGSCAVSVRGRYARNEIDVRLRPGESAVKSVWIDQKKVGRLSEMMGVLRCVIFSPEDLSLIREGPAVRRRFLDMMISQLDRRYFIALQQYRAAMDQRNAILRNARIENMAPNPMIQDFEAAMSEYGEIISREREKYTSMLSEKGKELYREISGRDQENFEIAYHASVHWDGAEKYPLAAVLEKSREEDLRQGSTSAGPHRDELLLTLNRRNMKVFASQGQIRTAALSMKLAQMTIFREVTDDQPILLLDDVMSELDLKRRMNLLRLIDGIQTFITCSDEGDLEAWQNNRTYHVYVEDGRANLLTVKEGTRPDSPVLTEPTFE